MTQNDSANNMLLPLFACAILLIVIVMKTVGLVMTTGMTPVDDPLYHIRQITYLLVWVALLNYFYSKHLVRKYDIMLPYNVKSQERAAFIASVACAVKAVWTLAHTLVSTTAINVFSIYYIAESIAWFLFAWYLFGSFSAIHNMRKDMEQGIDMDDDV